MTMVVGYQVGHEASLAVVNGAGRVEFAASEERFTRRKLESGLPSRAAAAARARASLDGAIAVHGGLAPLDRLRRELALTRYCLAHGLALPWHPGRARRLARRLAARSSRAAFLAGHPRRFVEHHTCHAASAYYLSGFDQAVVVTADGVGDTYSACIFRGQAGRLERLAAHLHIAAPLGHNYQLVAAMLGFHPHRHTGKVTGLAAGAPVDQRLAAALERYLAWVWSRRGRPYFFMLHSEPGRPWPGPTARRALAELRQARVELFGAWSAPEIAAAAQHLLERAVVTLISRAVPRPGGEPLALAGGVFANVRLNRVLKDLGFGELFVQPAMGDAGLALGGPLAVIAEAGGGLAPHRLPHVFLGPAPGEEECREALAARGLAWTRPADPEAAVARLLAAGCVVGRCAGPMEFGPRALGNRSILAPACDRGVVGRLNRALGRSPCMPFAPATLADEAAASYRGLSGCEAAAAFMTVVFDSTPAFRRRAPAVVHVDGTARAQLVTASGNPALHRLLVVYRRETGFGTVLNTSFNRHDEPIVLGAREAVDTFLAAGLDHLLLGPFLVTHPARAAAAAEAAGGRSDAA